MPAADYRRPTAHDAALGDVDVTRTLYSLFCFVFGSMRTAIDLTG